MDHDIIRRVMDFGFDVYMRNLKDTWLYFTESDQIGYLQHDPHDGFGLSTVHVPNMTTGTGFQVTRHADDFTEAKLRQCFHMTVGRVCSKEAASVVKWRNIEHLIGSDSWSRQYRKIEREDLT